MSEDVFVHSHFFEERQLTEECKHGWASADWLMENVEKDIWFSKGTNDYLPFHSRKVIVDIAAEQYEGGLISLGRAAEIAGLKYDTMLDELEKRGIAPHFGPPSIEEAEKRGKRLVASLKKLRRRS